MKIHFLGQSAHVVVALDDLARDVQAFDAVWVDCSLGQPFGIGNFLCFCIEHINETFTDNFAFALGVSDARKFGEELLAGIHAYHVQAQAFVVVEHIAEFILAQHAVVHEDASEVGTNGAMEQNGCH